MIAQTQARSTSVPLPDRFIPQYLSEPEALSTTNTIAVHAAATPFPLTFETYDLALNGQIACVQHFDVLMVNSPHIGDRLKSLLSDQLGEGWDVAWRCIGCAF